MKCLFPPCSVQVDNSHFAGACSHAHKKAAFIVARNRGLELLRKEASETPISPLPQHDKERAKKHRERILEMLRAADWLDHPYDRFPAMWHSRISELRQQGHRISCRVVVDAEGRRDYQYKLEETA